MSAAAKTKSAKKIAYIGMGSNIEPELNLPRALNSLRQQLNILCISSTWHSPALGTLGPDFLNAVIKIETEQTIEELKNNFLRPIEATLGRARGSDKNAPRTIDLDILIFGGEIIDPHIWEFAHLAVPLAECNAELADPSRNQTISQVSAELQNVTNIRKASLKFELNK